MAIPKPASAVDRARQHVRGVVQACERSGTPVLPCLDQLAADAGVSRMTMWRVVDTMRDEGELVCGRGRRIMLAGYAEAQRRARQRIETRGRSRDQCVRVEREIRESLVNGSHATDEPLPSIKELGRRHDASYWTVRRALETLCGSGELQRHGRTYRRASRMEHTPGRSVVLIAWGLGGRLNMVSSRTQDQLRALEAECSRLGLRLVVYSFDMLFEGESSREFIDEMRRTRPLGFVLWETGIPPDFTASIIEVLRRLSAPIAVLAESWTGPPFATSGQGSEVAWYTLGNAAADGVEVGRYLHGLGHRHLAFISTDHRDGDGHSWVRWQGLLEVFGTRGNSSSAELFTIDLGDNGIHDLTFANAVRQAADLLYNPAPGPVTNDQRELRRASQEFLGLARTSLNTITEKPVFSEALDRALGRTHVTCWVGDNDVTALACLSHLNRRGVRVPQRISVAGFDDGFRSLMAGLTSYNFGGAEIMRGIMAFITRPHQRRPRGPIGVKGRVVARATTGSPSPSAHS